MIPDAKIDDVRAASDIVDVVSDYVKLRKRGTNYFGLCPFHNEKTPSFSVNPALGIFKCFGCGEGGNAITFVQKMENVGFPEAVRMLADRAGIVLPQEEHREEDTETETIYHALRFAARFFYHQLTRTDAGQSALAYLRGRGFENTTIKQFGLGWAPDAWSSLLDAAGAEHIASDILEKAGLVLPRKQGDGYYDRFRGRVMFPILSHVGKVLGFGGRILTNATDQPKYINSPETAVYNKSRVLYGLYQGKQAVRRSEEVLLVEGYTDVIALHQAGVENVVASSGTALTTEQVKMIGRYARRVVLLYDADAAGAGAALRGIDLVLAQGLSAYAVALPPGEDPDSFVRERGSDGFRKYADKHRQDFVAFAYALARREGRLDTPEGATETMHRVLDAVARIPDPLAQETYVRRASEVLGVPDVQLRAAMKAHHSEQRRTERPRPAGPAFAPPDARPSANPPATLATAEPLPEEKMLLRLMLENGKPLVEFVLGHMALEEFTEGPSRQIAEAFLAMYQEDKIAPDRFFGDAFSDPVQRLAAEVMIDRYAPSEHWQRREIPVPRLNEDPHETAASAMTLLKLDRVDEAIRRQKARLFRAAQQDDEMRDLQAEMMGLHELRKQIERRAFLEWNTA